MRLRGYTGHTRAVLSIEQFTYELPDERIAQSPVEPRDSARLLDALGPDLVDRQVNELPSLIRPGDVIVMNDTRVIPARLSLRKETGGAVEILLVEPAEPAGCGQAWHALVKPSRRVAPGSIVNDLTGQPAVEVGEDLGEGRRVVRSVNGESLLDVAKRIGAVPLPPYITESLNDAERYQTVYSRNERSVAAPTAGLHLTPALLDACRSAGAATHTIELAVGLGTFRPILVEDVSRHAMHGEQFLVSPEVLAACHRAERVIAIGTTTVRALESAATLGQRAGTTELFISPGYEWKLVDVLLTNFHQPRSSLLVMLSAFAGRRWREIYDRAIDREYRFLSFGDAMIVTRERPAEEPADQTG